MRLYPSASACAATSRALLSAAAASEPCRTRTSSSKERAVTKPPNNKSRTKYPALAYMAERVRFELTVPSSGTPAFEAGAFNRSTTSPCARRHRIYPRLGVDPFLELGRWLSAEDLSQLLGRLILEHARGHVEPVVGLPRLQHVERAAISTALGIARGIHDALEPRGDDCAGTHHARLFGDVERSLVQPPRAEPP